MGLQSPHFGSILAVTGIGGLAKEHILIITLQLGGLDTTISILGGVIVAYIIEF